MHSKFWVSHSGNHGQPNLVVPSAEERERETIAFLEVQSIIITVEVIHEKVHKVRS